ncbi:MAG: isoprenylcysteine carboxylmethyltransferase family protein [Hyphomonadaceae bacterium]|nr:isoprenylcysteine carboxylmethyltransferase family protein [Hyphomonadaceae bacterium]
MAERHWKLAVAAALMSAALTWFAPGAETHLGAPAWAGGPALRWAAAALFVVSVLIVAIAQIQMGASWRIGVPKEGPGPLVARGLFAWSRNPIFLGMLGTALALFVWSPHILTAAVLAATWTLTLVQVRIEEEALREKHGDDYERYATRVGRWFGRRHFGVARHERLAP